MKKLILKNILIAIIAFIVLETNSIYASMADYTDEEADAQTKKSQQEWKEEQKEIVNKSTNNYLKSLMVEGYKLTPEFDKQTLEYNLNISNEVKEITIIANSDDNKATIKGNGKVEVQNNKTECKIEVTAESGTVRTYTIKINNIQEKETEKESEKEVETVSSEFENSTLESSNIIENETTQVTNEDSSNKEISTTNKYIPIIIIAIIIGGIILIKIIQKNKHKAKRSK